MRSLPLNEGFVLLQVLEMKLSIDLDLRLNLARIAVSAKLA
jgi:hypothetical protein